MNTSSPVFVKNQNAETIFDFLSNKSTQWILPRYQRAYVWSPKKINNLLEDIETNHQHQRPLWLGTILASESGNKINIVDGQQRILTFILIWYVLKNQPFDFDISAEQRWVNFWLAIDDQDADFIYFKHIINYVFNKLDIITSKRLEKIVACIENFKKEIADDLPKFINFMQSHIFINILFINSDQYDYFETINSKNIPLTLTDKCFAFLTNKFPEEILQQSQTFQWWLSLKKVEKEMVTSIFVEIFTTKNNSYSKLDKFKLIVENHQKIQEFILFLELYRQLKEESITNFYEYYLRYVAWDNYWPLIVILKLKKYHELIIDNFLQNLWKVDLWTYILKSSNQDVSQVINVTRMILLTDSQNEANIVLNQFWVKKIKLIDPTYTGYKEKTISKQDFNLIEKNNRNTSRVAMLLYLLLSFSNIDVLRGEMQQAEHWLDFNYQKWKMDYIVSLKSYPQYRKTDKTMLCNLILVKKSVSTEINKNIVKKIQKKDQLHIFRAKLYQWDNILYYGYDDHQVIKTIWKQNKEMLKSKFEILRPIWKLDVLTQNW